MEIDLSTYDKDDRAAFAATTGASEGEGGVATAVWAPPRPTLDVITDLPDQDEYEVRIYDTKRRRRLVAAVEIVSPANKDRPENRRAFVTKCAALLQQRVSVAIVDLVAPRQFNLYGDLLRLIGEMDPALAPEPPPIYATACRRIRRHAAWHLETWAHPLAAAVCNDATLDIATDPLPLGGFIGTDRGLVLPTAVIDRRNAHILFLVG
ncbi:MAG: DUF4058 family protein [Isosphaeraceae bacterium]